MLAITPRNTTGGLGSQLSDEVESLGKDEPPGTQLSFGRLPIFSPTAQSGEHEPQRPLCKDRQHSLLTQALQTSPNTDSTASNRSSLGGAKSAFSTHGFGSTASTAELTSDGGLTSPPRSTTPSPPLPPTRFPDLTLFDAKNIGDTTVGTSNDMASQLIAPQPAADQNDQSKKRSITFACPKLTAAKENAGLIAEKPNPEPAPKRTSILRFACPLKPTKENGVMSNQGAGNSGTQPSTSDETAQDISSNAQHLAQRTGKNQLVLDCDKDRPTISIEHSPLSPSPEVVRSEALRFHEFASAKPEEDEWISAKPVQRQKITVTDTLRKENAIRKLGEEAEEEALEEEIDEGDEEENAYRDDGDGQDEEENDEEVDEEPGADGDDDDDDVAYSDSGVSDRGNETDDEEGFGASDDDSEADSDYQFWTPGVNTAATSTDHFDPVRPRQGRSDSESSFENSNQAVDLKRTDTSVGLKQPRVGRRSAVHRMRPGTPELPDSTDFICGTLDEDRPLEAAYISCMEQRKLSKYGVKPQDFDPSFPTSDPELEVSNNEAGSQFSDDQAWIFGCPDESEEALSRGHQGTAQNNSCNPPGTPPKRPRSPAPKRPKLPAPVALKRGRVSRSPPPWQLFGHSPRRLKSPPPRSLRSPPSSRQHSYKAARVSIPRLAQRPNLALPKSLPRTPNPGWRIHTTGTGDGGNGPTGTAGGNADIQTIGPIGIVQGLERKRQQRKEKYLRLHSRNLAKDKEKRYPPGEGAQRMRELGLEMADRCKGLHGQRIQLMLSI